jgi:hypothetical protein
MASSSSLLRTVGGLRDLRLQLEGAGGDPEVVGGDAAVERPLERQVVQRLAGGGRQEVRAVAAERVVAGRIQRGGVGVHGHLLVVRVGAHHTPRTALV